MDFPDVFVSEAVEHAFILGFGVASWFLKGIFYSLAIVILLFLSYKAFKSQSRKRKVN